MMTTTDPSARKMGRTLTEPLGQRVAVVVVGALLFAAGIGLAVTANAQVRNGRTAPVVIETDRPLETSATPPAPASGTVTNTVPGSVKRPVIKPDPAPPKATSPSPEPPGSSATPPANKDDESQGEEDREDGAEKDDNDRDDDDDHEEAVPPIRDEDHDSDDDDDDDERD